jgi:hypothetical protein
MNFSAVTNPRLPTLIIMQYRMVGRRLAHVSHSIHQTSTTWLCCLALAAASSGTLQAATDLPQPASQAVLVELFTSEGCSSCPPADRLLVELDRQQPVSGATIVVLSEHVDYWDHEGWRDPFSSHQWTERQEEYVRQFGLESPATPQIVIDGSHQVTGGDGRAVLAAIEQSAKTPRLDIAISTAERSSDGIHLEITAAAAKGATLYVVLADDADHSSVTHGENAGRTIDHVAVARAFVRVGKLDKSPLDQKLVIPILPGAPNRRLRLIVFAQDGHSGHIVGVTAREL